MDKKRTATINDLEELTVTEILRCGFNNAIIKAPVDLKPHICKRAGWWRVSALAKRQRKFDISTNEIRLRWNKAHEFVRGLHWGKLPNIKEGQK